MDLDRLFIFRGDCHRIESVMKMGSDGIFVTASSYGLLKVWSSHDEICKRTIDVPREKEVTIGVVSETSIFVVGKTSMSVWRVEDQVILARSHTGFKNCVSCLILDSNTAVIVDISGTLTKVEWKLGCIYKVAEVKSPHEEDITNAICDGNLIAVSSQDKTVSVWNASALTQIRSFDGHESSVTCVASQFSFLVSGSSDSTIRVYDIRDSKLLTVLKAHEEGVKAVQFLENSDIIVSAGGDDAIAFHELPSGNLLAKYFFENITSFAQLDSRTLIVAEYGYSKSCEFSGSPMIVGGSRMRRIGIADVFQEGTHGQLPENENQSLSASKESTVKDNCAGSEDLLKSLRRRIKNLELFQHDTIGRMNQFETRLRHC